MSSNPSYIGRLDATNSAPRTCSSGGCGVKVVPAFSDLPDDRDPTDTEFEGLEEKPLSEGKTKTHKFRKSNVLLTYACPPPSSV